MPKNRPSLVIFLCVALSIFSSCAEQKAVQLKTVSTVAAAPGEFSEPFGIAVKDDETYISDGATGKILKMAADGTVSDFATNFETPSSIAFAKNGDLVVADTGSHSIKS